MHAQHARPAGEPRPCIGHGRRPALVPGGDVSGAVRDQRVGHVKVAAADDAEHGVGAEVGERPRDGVGDEHQDRSTSASTRAGLPDPPTMGSGPAISTAPVGGSAARFCSCVSPYLPAPSSAEWQGNGGSKECAAPASVPTVSTPMPDDRRLLGQPSRALHRDAGRVRPGLVGVEEVLLAVRPGVPAGPVQQPAAVGQRPVVGLPLHDVIGLQQEVRVGRRLRAEIQHDGRRDQAGHRYLGDILAVAAADPVHWRVEMGTGVLAGADVVPVPGRPALVVPADLVQRERHGVREGLGQLDHRSGGLQPGGQIDDLDRCGPDRSNELVKHHMIISAVIRRHSGQGTSLPQRERPGKTSR